MTDELFDLGNLEDSRHPNHRLYKSYRKILEGNNSFAKWLREEYGAELTPESMRAARNELFIDWFFESMWPEGEDRVEHQKMRLLFETKWQEMVKSNQERARDDAEKVKAEIDKQMTAARLGVNAEAPKIVGPDGRPLFSGKARSESD